MAIETVIDASAFWVAMLFMCYEIFREGSVEMCESECFSDVTAFYQTVPRQMVSTIKRRS